MKKNLVLLVCSAFSALYCGAQEIYFAMDNNLKESNSSMIADMRGVRTLPYVDGVIGKALRFDGYSNYADVNLDYSKLSTTDLTISLWIAPETYPMMNVNEAESIPSFSMVTGNYDESAKTGFGIMLSSQGDIKFQCYLKSWPLTCQSTEKLPLGKWSQVVVTIDKANNKIFMYLNGVQVASAKCPYELTIGKSSFMIGRSRARLSSGPFDINTFNGLIDEVKISNGVSSAAQISQTYSSVSLSEPELAVSKDAYRDNILRPIFHGMPSHSWTNECHGMAYSNGKYHLFFQKNGNGPYMARLHWGHISSTDLLNWQEEPIAIAPSETYDIKGCWSGCVFSDDEITNGNPYILYTGVDNARARICMASPLDINLNKWEKKGVIIDGRPSGLSDDFRDPYFFRANGSKYIVVGTSKDGIGACTLHKYNSSTKTWTNTGSIFFKGSSAAQCGTFWEMPVVEPIGGGKYLFCCTPLNTSEGVKTLYWVGSISASGTFVPDFESPKEIEMNGVSRHGYGLLSPTFINQNGKTIMVGIVPDKIADTYNYQWGWAHNYSLPREITWSEDKKTMLQKPISVDPIKQNGAYVASNLKVNNEIELGVNGFHVEMKGQFTYDVTTKQGFRFLKNGSNYAEISIGGGTVTLDLTKMSKVSNDNGIYNGIYSAPISLAPASDVVLDVYLDGSIVDVFVNGSQAFSVRLFPTDNQADGIALFSSSTKNVAYVAVWSLTNTNTHTPIKNIIIDDTKMDKNHYNLQGCKVGANSRGLIIHNRRKYIKF